jgi:chemotaxis signal transduction protein
MTAAFLDREPDAADRERWRQELAAPPAAACDDGRVVLFLFRVGGERFGIEPSFLDLALPAAACHSIPHRSPALAGVVNIRGTVTLSFSLTDILGSLAGPASSSPMLLVLAHNGWRVACRVDVAEGVCGFERSALRPPPATLPEGTRPHVKGIFPSEENPDVAWLDARSLFAAFDAAAR